MKQTLCFRHLSVVFLGLIIALTVIHAPAAVVSSGLDYAQANQGYYPTEDARLALFRAGISV